MFNFSAKCNKYSNTHPQLTFAAHRNTTSKGFIAVDDITVKEGPCGDQSMYLNIIKCLMQRKH